MCTQESCTLFFFFKAMNSTYQNKDFFFICKISLSVFDFSTYPLCYISPEWAVNGIMWNVRRIRYSKGTRKGVQFSSPPSSNDLFSLPGGQPCHQYEHFIQCTLPAASIYVIPTVALNAHLTGQFSQNFSNLRFKSKAKQLYDKWIRAISLLPLEGNTFFFLFPQTSKSEGRLVGKKMTQGVSLCFNQY